MMMAGAGWGLYYYLLLNIPVFYIVVQPEAVCLVCVIMFTSAYAYLFSLC